MKKTSKQVRTSSKKKKPSDLVSYVCRPDVKTRIASKLLLQLARKLMSSFEVDQVLEIVITNSAEIKRLNNAFRKKNKATDVLSFASLHPTQLGTVIIDWQTAKKQAKTYKHSLDREIQELFVHGFLHLLGYDHIRQHEARKMKKMELLIQQQHLD